MIAFPFHARPPQVHHAIGGNAEIFYKEVATNPQFNACREVGDALRWASSASVLWAVLWDMQQNNAERMPLLNSYELTLLCQGAAGRFCYGIIPKPKPISLLWGLP